MNDVKITVGGAIEDEASRRFIDAWKRGVRVVGRFRHATCISFSPTSGPRVRPTCGVQRCTPSTLSGESIMADIKEKIENAGQSVADAAKKAGNAVKDGAEKAADWTKDKAAQAGDKAADAAKKTGEAVKQTGQDLKDKSGK